jgi:hypothetical protein
MHSGDSVSFHSLDSGNRINLHCSQKIYVYDLTRRFERELADHVPGRFCYLPWLASSFVVTLRFDVDELIAIAIFSNAFAGCRNARQITNASFGARSASPAAVCFTVHLLKLRMWLISSSTILSHRRNVAVPCVLICILSYQ